MKNNSNPNPPWKIVDIVLALIFVFGVSNFFNWFLHDLMTTLVPVQRFLLSGAIQSFSVFVAVFFVVRLRYGQGLAQLGLKIPDLQKVVTSGVAGGAALFVLVVTVGVIIEQVFPVKAEPQPFARLVLEADSTKELVLLFFIGSIMAPLGEEIYFRGFVYPVFRRKWGVGWGVILTGVFFALLHVDLIRFLPLALGGAGLAWLYQRTGSLLTAVIAHGVWNGVMMGLLYFSHVNL